MVQKYPHMLAPVKVGGKILRNRLLSPCAMPHFLMGPELWPAEPVIRYFENMARAGASLVTIREQNDDTRNIPVPDMCHTPYWDRTDPRVQNYYSQLADAVHFQGALASVFIKISTPPGYDVCECELGAHLGGRGAARMAKAMTEELMQDMIDEAAEKALFYKRLGYDACVLHMAYTAPMMARFISPLTNKRTDEYGGSMENRAKFPIAILRAIKEACGQDFIVEIELTAEETAPGGMSLDESIAFAKLCEGVVDIFQLRLDHIDPSHPTGYSYDGTPKTLAYAEAFKKAGVKGLIVPCGGFQDFDMIEDAIATGKCDAVTMARSFMADPDYLTKAIEGRPEDVIPCVRCNKCHAMPKDKWVTICSVNPMLGFAHRQEIMEKPSRGAKNVAIIGGGPAGLRAAIFCEERGHSVTVYEKRDVLGGQLTHADYPSFKWPLKKYKDWLIAQCEKREKIKLVTGMEATPEMIEALGFDAVIVAVGSEPRTPAIPGALETGTWFPIEVYGREAELGQRVVVVGGSETGTETGMYLAEAGHDVTVLTRNEVLAKDGMSVHYYSMVRDKWESYPNFKGICHAVTTKIEPGRVTYTDADGEHTLDCDDIVLSGGVRELDEVAMSYYGTAPIVLSAGDCLKAGALNDVNFSAFAAACKL